MTERRKHKSLYEYLHEMKFKEEYAKQVLRNKFMISSLTIFSKVLIAALIIGAAIILSIH